MVILIVTDRAKIGTQMWPTAEPWPFFCTLSLSLPVTQKGQQTGWPRSPGDPGICPRG